MFFKRSLAVGLIAITIPLAALPETGDVGEIRVTRPGVALTEAGKTAGGAPVSFSETAAPVAPAPAQTPPPPAATPAPAIDPRRFLFASHLADFSAPGYTASVRGLLAAFESSTGVRLQPGPLKKVALKLYTSSGPGIATSKELTRAVIAEMEKRGFARENILLVDLSERRLRETGYLPRLRKEGENFEGCPVLALDTERYYNPRWHYENPLASKEVSMRPGDVATSFDLSDRLSFLPVPLLLEVDFWINLPVAMDSPALGVSGALGNATIWNISNQRRFLDNPSNAEKAAVEIAAIPEFKEKFLLSILSLERYQYIGGPRFDANHCISEKRVWLSANPLILDYLVMQRMNNVRAQKKFPLIDPEPFMFIRGNTPPILLGSCVPSEITLVKVDPAPGKNAAAGTAAEENTAARP